MEIVASAIAMPETRPNARGRASGSSAARRLWKNLKSTNARGHVSGIASNRRNRRTIMSFKLSIAGESTPKPEPEIEVVFSLRKNSDGSVDICAYRPDRNSFNAVLTIRTDGRIERKVFGNNKVSSPDFFKYIPTGQGWLAVEVVDEFWSAW
jgi:hypothetical protein